MFDANFNSEVGRLRAAIENANEALNFTGQENLRALTLDLSRAENELEAFLSNNARIRRPFVEQVEYLESMSDEYDILNLIDAMDELRRLDAELNTERDRQLLEREVIHLRQLVATKYVMAPISGVVYRTTAFVPRNVITGGWSGIFIADESSLFFSANQLDAGSARANNIPTDLSMLMFRYGTGVEINAIDTEYSFKANVVGDPLAAGYRSSLRFLLSIEDREAFWEWVEEYNINMSSVSRQMFNAAPGFPHIIDALVLPFAKVRQAMSRPYVILYDGDQTRRHFVTLGREGRLYGSNAIYVQILTGLEEGQRVVIN